MDSRERVLHAFNHQEADRIPVWCGASPEFIEKAKDYLGVTEKEEVYKEFGDDFRRVFSTYAGPDEFSPTKNLSEGMNYRTPFGIERAGIGYGQPDNHPLAEANLEQIHAYHWPDPDWIDVTNINKDASKYEGKYAILGGEWSPFWHDAIDLLGMENLLIKMYEEPEIVTAVLEHIVDYYAAVTQQIFEEAGDIIDIFFIGNDFGSQTGPLLSEKLFRKFMFPHLKRLADLGHQYDLYVMMHCCGGFFQLIPTMIEAGIDALQALQPSARGMEPAELKKQFGDEIVFNGCIDTQHVLIEGNPELVRKRTKEIMRIMKPGGGYILSPSHDYLLEETPVENVIAMYDTVKEYGYYK